MFFVCLVGLKKIAEEKTDRTCCGSVSCSYLNTVDQVLQGSNLEPYVHKGKAKQTKTTTTYPSAVSFSTDQNTWGKKMRGGSVTVVNTIVHSDCVGEWRNCWVFSFWTITLSVRVHQISCGQASSITSHNVNWTVAVLLIEISIFIILSGESCIWIKALHWKKQDDKFAFLFFGVFLFEGAAKYCLFDGLITQGWFQLKRIHLKIRTVCAMVVTTDIWVLFHKLL